MTIEDLKLHRTYRFTSGGDDLIYIGKNGIWNQFERVCDRGTVWCEILDSDLWMIYEVKYD